METLKDTGRPCPHDICDGSGMVDQGMFDDIEYKKCLCRIEAEQDELANS